jgi:hypothetical protein
VRPTVSAFLPPSAAVFRSALFRASGAPAISEAVSDTDFFATAAVLPSDRLAQTAPFGASADWAPTAAFAGSRTLAPTLPFTQSRPFLRSMEFFETDDLPGAADAAAGEGVNAEMAAMIAGVAAVLLTMLVLALIVVKRRREQEAPLEHEGDAFDIADFGVFDWNTMTEAFPVTGCNPDTGTYGTAMNHFTAVMTDAFGTETVEAAGFLDFGY